jgi:D-glycero-D-manno-heptose 1,7-bisphosphate phosphatase
MSGNEACQDFGEISYVFLDRDGVINKKMPEGAYVTCVEDVEILPGVEDAISRLNHAGIKVLVVSNQRGVALGLYTSETVDSIHEKLQQSLRLRGAHIDRFYFCPHDRGQCRCRKPLPGMFDLARLDFSELDPGSSAMVGDSVSDVEFGSQLGMYTVYIEGSMQTRKAGAEQARALANASCQSLSEAVDLICSGDSRT